MEIGRYGESAVSKGRGKKGLLSAKEGKAAQKKGNFAIFSHMSFANGKKYGLFSTKACKAAIFAICLVSLITILAIPAFAGLLIKQQTDSLTSGLVGWWTFDGNDMNRTHAFDKSGNNNNGTINNATEVAGKLGQSMQFYGNRSYVDCGTNLGMTNSFTLSAWIYPSNFTSTTTIISKGNFFPSNSTNYAMDLRGTGNRQVAFFLYDSSNNFHGMAPVTEQIPINQWVHVVGVYNSASTPNFQVYINGVVSVNTTNWTGTMVSNAVSTQIGDRNGSYYFSGKIDDVRIYNRALSSDEIKSLYNMGAASMAGTNTGINMASGLVGYWTFDGKDSNSTHVFDKSGNGNNGTIIGATRAPGKIGQGMSFDGVNDYLSIPNFGAMGTNDFSVSFWTKTPAVTPNSWYDTFISPGKGNNTPKWENNWAIVKEGDAASESVQNIIEFAVGKGTGADYFRAVSTIKITDTNWHHIVGTANRHGSAIVYIDGVNRGSTDISSVIADLTAPNGTAIGNNNGGGFYLTGYMDDVRIYNRVLTADEIAALYNLGASNKIDKPMTITESGLVGYWTFDGKDTNATHAYDMSGNNNNATIVGAAKAAGKIGQGMKFDGVSSYVNAGNTYHSIANGTVTLTNIRLSIINGTTFADFSSAGALTNYIGDKVVITDSAGNNLTGYIKAAGTGETYGANQINNNSGFEGTYVAGVAPSWSLVRGTASEYTADPHGGTSAQQINNPASNSGFLFESSHTQTSGNLFRASVWYKVLSGIGQFGWSDNTTSYSSDLTSSTWAQGIIYRTVSVTHGTSLDIYANWSSSANTNQVVYDDASATQVLTPSATGVTITDTANGGNYNWTSEDTNFKRNDTSGYTYAIYPEVESVSFWAKPSNTTQYMIDLDGGSHYVWLNSGTVTATGFSGATIYVDGVQTSTISNTNWHHITVTTASSISATSLAIGKANFAYFTGLIDDVRIYNRMLSSSEILQLYNMGR